MMEAMPDETYAALAPLIERARKVLQHEQRTHHQDQAIRPGGVELFAANWIESASEACNGAGLDVRPVYRFVEHLEGYRRQDPMQRAASLRAALAVLGELEHDGPGIATSLDNGHRAPLAGTSEPTIPQDDGVLDSKNGAGAGPGASGGKRTRTATSGPAPQAPPPVPFVPLREEEVAPKGGRGVEASEDLMRPTTTNTGSQVDGKVEKKAPAGAQQSVRLEAGMTAGHVTLTLLSAEITAVPGVGPTVATRLHSLGIHTVRDLLFYFPREHRDYSKLTRIANIPLDEVTTTMGLIWEVKNAQTGRGRARTIATISDETGKLNVTWFNQPYLFKQLKAAQGSYLVVTGVKVRFGNKVEFNVRSHELPEQGDLLNTGRLVPIYPLTEGLYAKTLRRFTKWVVDRYAAMLPDHLPAWLRFEGKLLPLPEAVMQIHYPENEEMRGAARRRLAFDELLLIQLGMQERRSRWQLEAQEGHAFRVDLAKIFSAGGTVEGALEISNAMGGMADGGRSQASIQGGGRAGEAEMESPLGATLWSVATTSQPFEATLPFRFTEAQRRVIGEIVGDLAHSRPMCRLLQGDVGAGKTAVAAAALYVAALNGYQGAIMAPTELLAEQHGRSIGAMLAPFGLHTVLLTGSLKQRERAAARAAIESGQAVVAVGTHALLQEEVNFHRLGLVIVDEQHRFGVEQRDALRQKGYHPHMLVMTATPIPRTLALTLYGDLDVSAIDQLPPGRLKIMTRWRTGARRNEAYHLIAQEVSEGRQAFIICPLIEESESLAVKAATTEYERLGREVFPNLRLGLLHGAMKSVEKDQVMRHFRDGQLDLLVATSVIEVGIDVPNATVMVIEDADRFGLSQLHQFRGRVGRGKHQSYCYVLSADAGALARDRLEVFQSTDDGFELSEQDLRLRGPGDFMGVRQSGMPELRMANLSDTPLIELSRALAEKLWQRDPYLRKPEHAALHERMHMFWQHHMAH